MKTHVTLRLAAMVAAAALAAPAPSRADDSQNHTTVFLTAPVQIPGMTLQAGTYLFETTAARDGRHAVRICGSDCTKVIATAEAVPMKRNGALIDVVELRPTILGTAPTALKGWLRQGGDGFQFVYPAREAAEIANRTATRVVASAGEAGKGDALVVIDAYGTRAPWTADMPGL